jgi:hypothetical protein
LECDLSDKEIEQFALEHSMPVFKTSAKTNRGVDQPFEYMAWKCVKKMRTGEQEFIMDNNVSVLMI